MSADYDLVSLDHVATPVLGAQIKGPHVVRVHAASKCAGRACVIHAPSDHHMTAWSLNWRADIAVMERLCPHGIGHPDPDDLAYHRSNGDTWQAVHGCDGCCSRAASRD